VKGHASWAATADLALACVQTGPDAQSEIEQLVADIECAADRAGSAVENRGDPMLAGLDLALELVRTSAPLVAMVLEGPQAIAVVRSMVGATRPAEAAPGTIRGDLALETAQNLIHASDGPETATAEVALWFGADELLTYDREIDRWALAPEE